MDFRLYEKTLKRYLKRKKSVTISLIVCFLITGGIEGTEEIALARDLRSRGIEANSIRVTGETTLNNSANGIDVINIVTPDKHGISHNKFTDLSVGTGNGLIFNNSTEHGISKIGGYVTKNSNLKNNASVILNEVMGNRASNINGSIEIFGKKADFILANENGINVNGATFINTNGITLTTGSVLKDSSGINFDVQKGNIFLNGVGTSGNYFNVLAKTIEIHNEISPINGEEKPDITLISGQNKIELKKGDFSNPIIKSSSDSKQDKYGIYATELGAMYGRNIRLISTGQGLGVKHEGAIFSEKDIVIESNGDISVATLNSRRDIKIKGNNFETKEGVVKVANKEQINSISSKNNISLDLKGDVRLRSAVQSTNGNIVITARGLTLQDKSSARLISTNYITIKLSERLDVQGVLIPTISGVDSENLAITSNPDGSLQVKDINTGKIYSSDQITWQSTGIFGKDVEIFVKELTNKGIVSAENKLTITAENLLNEKDALLRARNFELGVGYSFVNKGEIRVDRRTLNEVVDPNGKLKIEVLKGKFENYGNISAKDITITAQELINALNGKVIASDGNIILTTTVGELVNNGEILATKDLKLISANNLTNTGKLGADSILIQAVQGKFLNAGHITAVKDLVINVKELLNAGSSEEIEKYLGALYQYSEEELTKVENSISELNKKIAAEKDSAQLAELKATLSGLEEVKNKLNNLKDILSKTGMLGVLSGDNVKITTKESFENKGVVTSQKDLTLETGSVINSGVLQAGDNLLIEALGKIVNTQRITAGKKIIISGDSFVSNGNEERIKEYLELLQKLNSENLSAEELAELKAKIAAFSDLGVIEGETLAITTKTTLENNGIVITKGDVSLKSEDSIKNNGVMSVGKNLDVKGKSFSSKDLTIKENLSANISGDFNSYNLSVGGNVDVTSSKLENSGKLETGGGLNLTGDFSNKSGATASVGKSLNINGGVNNSGELLVGETIKINSENRNNGESFANSGNINASGEIEIGGSSFDNTGKITTGSKLDINVSGDIDNSGNIEAKNDISLAGKNLNNKNGDLVTEGNLTANISEKVTNGNMSVGNDINITSNGFHNSGSTVAGGNISLNTKTGDFGNSGKLHAAGKIDLDSRSAANSGEIIGNGVDISTKGSFFNTGSLQSKGSIVINNTGDVILTSGEVKASGDISITGNNSDIKLNGKVLSEGKIDVKSKTGDIETGKVQALGDISISTEKDIINKGMIVSNSNINLSADGIVNEEGNTIWAGKDAVLNAMREIYNSLNANIVSQNDMKLSAKSITNDAGTIAAGGNLDIKADNLTNKSRVDVKYEIVDTESSKQTVRWDDTFNYHLDSTEIWIPVIENKSVVTDKATIEAEGNLNISGFSSDKAKVNNYSGTILAGKDMTIKGDILNETAYQNLNVVDLLKLIQVRLSWETRLYLTNAYGNSGVSFEGSLYDALTKGYFGRGREAYYKALALVDNPLLNKVLSSVLGSDWKGKDKPISQDKWNFDGSFKYYAANGNAQIIAGGNFTHTNGSLVNNGGESGGNKNVNVNIGDNSIEGVGSNLDVDISDINSIKEVGGVKYPHDVELATGSITIDGVTITAETGNLAGAIAVSGTVNPIIFIDIPKGENGIFKPVEGEPQPGKPIYETNIDFIDPDKFFGSDYFFEQLGYDKNKTSAVLGDAYYDYLLLKDIIQKGLGYTGNVSAEDIQTLIDNAAEISATLGLELGKALTQDQINNLEHDIVWYVEVEVNGQKVLAPQLYLGKNSRINIAQNQGNGGTSTIKVGGDLVSDNTSFDNTNGNIDAGGNIIIKSSGDINNNSSGGMGGGISSDKNIAVDAAGDVNMIGGSLKGDNVIVSGDNVNIESTLGVDEKGNQIISDKAGIEADNGIQIDAKNDVNIKGGSLTASGEEIKPEEEGGAPGFEEPAPEQPEVVKDVDYYKELFKKESADIIEGDAGSININAGGDVNIKDIHTVSSEFKHEYDNGGFAQSSSTSATSNGSNLQGSNININGENVNIVGSDLSTNDTKEDANKDALPGSININAKNDVNIEDSKDLIHQDQYQKNLGTVNGLLTQESSRKELEASLSHGSSIKTSGDLNVSAGNDVTLKGSDVTVGGNANIDAENDLNILDGRNEVKEEFNESRYQVFGGGRTDVKKSSSTSVGSNISVGGDLNANAGNNIKVVGGNISANGDTNLSAGNDISIEAGKNEYHEEKKELNIGLYVEGSAGIGGVGVTGSASTADMSTSSEISTEWGGESAAGENLDGSNEKTPTTSGRPHMDQIVSGEFGVKLESKNTTIDETTWTESQISGDNINISAGNKVDIGGGDYKATGDISISGKQVDSTKYTDERTENSSGFSIAVKNTAGVNSAIVDTINKGVQMDSSIKSGNANDGILAAQGVGAVTNVIFNDAIGVTNKQSINVSIEDSTSKTTSENVSSVDAGGSVTIKATEGDINLNGVDVKAEDNINLDAKKDINITAAKKTSTENGFKVDLEAQLEESAGVSALWGANTDIGVGGSANLDITKKNSTDYENSTISAGGNISIKSGGDTNIDGGNVEAKKDVNLDIGGNLNIISKKSSHDNHEINANAGANVSIGAASNTIGKGEVGLSGGGGDIWSSGETVSQSGIKAGGNLNADIEGDLNIEGGILGSETGAGKVDVGGNINIKDITTKEQAGGAHITGSGGFTGDFGADGTIGDIKDKEVVSKGVIGVDNITAGGDVNINGEVGSVEDIYKDMENTQIVTKDIYQKGGDISLSGSTSNIKDVKDKVDSISSKFGGTSKTSGINKGNDSDGINVGGKSVGDSDRNSIIKGGDDKYSVLDKDNAFDFPQREDTGTGDVVLKDTAGETIIIPENYIPLGMNPPDKEASQNDSFMNQSIDEVISSVDERINDILARQDELIERQVAGEKVEKGYLDKKLEKLKESIERYIEANKDKNLSDDQKQKVEELLERFNEYDQNNDNYLEGNLQVKRKITDDVSILVRSNKDIRQNLKTIAKESDKIPKEHLLNYLDGVLNDEGKNKALEDALKNTPKGEKTIILQAPTIEHDKESEKNLNTIYKDIFDKTDDGIRKTLDDKFKDRVENDQDIKKLVSEGDTSPEKVLELAKKLQQLKAETFKDVVGAEYKKIPIDIYEGYGNILGGNDGVSLKIYLDSNYSFDYIFGTIVHELTHQDQRSLKDLKIEGFNDRNKLYDLNFSKGGYIASDSEDYETQPIEKEAYESEKLAHISLKNIKEKQEAERDLDEEVRVLMDRQIELASKKDKSEADKKELSNIEKKLMEVMEKINAQIKKEDKNLAETDDKYDVLDRSNAFDLPQDDGIRAEIKDIAGEEVIIPEHYEPLNGNPDKYKKAKAPQISAPMKHTVTINGERVHREENNASNSTFIDKRGAVATNVEITSPLKYPELLELKKPLIITSSKDKESFDGISFKDILTSLDLQDSNLEKLATEFSTKNLNEVNLDILLKEDKEELSELEKDILKNTLGTQLGAQGLQKIHQSLKELEKNSSDTIAKEKLSEGITEIKVSIDNTTLDLLLEHGHKVYVSLAEVITDSSGNVKLENVSKIFDPNEPNFETEEYQKLRHLIEKHLGNLNLKFAVDKQVIDLPKDIKNIKFNDKGIKKDKYVLLDKPNPFDLPQDDGIRAEIKDTAGEEVIVPEHYTPLGMNPPDKEVSQNNKFKDQGVDEVISSVDRQITDILDRQNVLIERQSGGEKVEKTYLDNELDELRKNIEEYIEVNKDKKLSNEQKQEIEEILEKFSKYEESNQKYFDGKPQRIFEVDEKISVLTRSDKDIYQNLKTVAKESDKIPKEHLLNYLDRLLKNTEKNEVLEKITESTDEKKNKQTILENPLIDHNKESEKNLNKVYKSIFDRTNGSVRKALDTEFRYIAEYDQNIKRMVSKGDTSPEGVRELAEKLQELKAEAFKAVLGVEYEKIPIEVQKSDGNFAGGNDGIKLKIYLDDEDSFDYVFETIVHELTHQDQKNLQKINIQGFEDRNKLYELNSLEGGYISTFGKDYETQPIEKEAHDSEKIAEEVLKSIRESEDAASYEDSYDEDNRFDILDEPNAFDLPQDDGIREEIKDTAGEEVIVPEYYEPLTGNPEDYKEKKKSNNLLDKNENKGLGETPLIYGTQKGRAILINEAMRSENKNVHVANGYLGQFNLEVKPLIIFAEKIFTSNLSNMEIEKILKFTESEEFKNLFEGKKGQTLLYKYEKEQISRVSEEANRKILTLLLENEKIKTISKDILKAWDKYSKNSEKRVENKKELNKAIDRFFELKTVTILEETFNNGGKIYFSLDEIATSNGKINLDKVLEVFNESHPMYHSITSAELRTAFRKYLDHPDLKFFLSKQVIELPNELKEKIKKEVEFENFKNQNPINNKNLLSFIPERDLGKTALVYGTKFGRGGLLRESSKSLNKNPHFTDAYLGKLNLGNENQEMIKFAEKVINGTLTDKDKEEIINPFPLLKNYKTDYTENQIGRVKEKANEELLNLVLEKDEVLKALNQITSGAEKIKKDKNSIEGKKEIEEGVQNFIKEKQIIILEKTFERGGKIYFSLDEIILTQNKDINFDRLLEVFDKSSKNYNSITSSELRTVFEKYLEHPNLKFVLGKQVIELPQKTKEKIKDMVSKNNSQELISLGKEKKLEQEMYQPDDEQAETSMDTTPPPPRKLTADEIINSTDFRYNFEKMKEYLTQRYGVESARIIYEELNLDNPMIKERIKIELENEMLQREGGITDENLLAFLDEMASKYINFEKENPSEYEQRNGFGGKVFVRTREGIRKQLETVAKNRDKIPGEHLQNFLANIFMNKEAKVIQKNGIEGKAMIASDLKLGKTYIDDIYLSSIFEMIPNKFSETRKEMNNLLVAELGENEYLKDFITREAGFKKEALTRAYSRNPDLLINMLYSLNAKQIPNDVIEKLLKEIDETRGKYFEEKVGLPYNPNKIKFVENPKLKGQVAHHDQATGTITVYKSSITTLGNLIDMLLHESQHHEQGIIATSKEKGKVSEEVREFYDLGRFAYIDGKKPTEHSLNMYKLQPIEKEAFEVMRSKEIIKALVESIIAGRETNRGSKVTKENNGSTGYGNFYGINNVSSKFDLLDKPNAFDLPQDDGVRIEIDDTANEPEIVAEHYEPLTGLPEKYRKEEKVSKNNRNIEADVKNEKLGDSPLSYGPTLSRGYLLEAIEDSPNKNNKTADSYLGKLNEGNNYEHLIELATKVTSKTLTSEDIEKVLDFDSSSFKTADKRYQREYKKVNSEVNRELLQEIIADKRVQKIFEKISKSAENIASGKKTLKDEITLNNSIHDFFIAKTSIVLEKTLKGNGQVYFSITEVIADKKGNINFDKLLNVFNPSSVNYDSVTSAELRVIFQKYLDHPNLKFVIGKHVIELPSEIKEKIKKESLLFNKKYAKNMNMLDGEASPEIDMDTYDSPLNVDDILDSENLGRFVARVKNSILLRYGPENFNNVKEYFNLENPIVRDMVRKDLEKALLLSNELVTGDNLDAFLSKNILENIRKQTERRIEEYTLTPGLEGMVYNRMHSEIKKQLQLVSEVADKLPSEHLQNFLANMFMNKEARKTYEVHGNENKKIIINKQGMKLETEDYIALGNIYKYIRNDFAEARAMMDNKLINELATNRKLQDFITQNGIIDKNLLREVYLENPEFVIEKIYNLNVKDISDEDIKLLLSVISEERKKIFEELLQVNYTESPLNIFDSSPIGQEKQLGFHNAVDGSINIVRTGISTLGVLLETVLHETQHQDQKLLSENKDSNMIPEATKELYLLNHYAYIQPGDLPPQLFYLYEKQPNEKEAFSVTRIKELIKLLVEDMIN
ncbi:Filamentous hemagglutinin [Fusobacterium necrogenes]|uniref:Filamentous hemagglutinin n=1 Tax=Fusobacterium necrogenes TaxID=858 RepID=A0A377GY05_9FUSO|nr:hemagglutinin repeat-containing protein [Fusobacterium necrogenes]STO31859.1 Filamentous hemagglutinin [Fusobacterium necrogenes]